MLRLETGRYVLCLLAGIALGACDSLPKIDLDKKIDYKSAGQLPPLEVPPDLTRPGADDRYRVPDINPRSTATYSEYSRERTSQRAGAVGSSVLPQLDNARIVRDGNQRWLVVKQTPERVWPLVKDFWQEAGFIINLEIPEAGIMETDYAESRARIPDPGWFRSLVGLVMDMVISTPERDKFRTRIERGVEPGTTEIYVSHRGMVEVYTAVGTTDNPVTGWQSRPSDPNLEIEMLGRLMMRFGVDGPQARAQLAGAPSNPPRATLSKGDNGARTLALDDQFDRAWRRVGLALDRVGFTVEDRDRSKGLYYVRYMDPQIEGKADDKGFLSRLKFWEGSEKPKLEQFRIHIKDGDAAGTRVNVLAKDGSQETSETAGRILTLLYDQLK